MAETARRNTSESISDSAPGRPRTDYVPAQDVLLCVPFKTPSTCRIPPTAAIDAQSAKTIKINNHPCVRVYARLRRLPNPLTRPPGCRRISCTLHDPCRWPNLKQWAPPRHRDPHRAIQLSGPASSECDLCWSPACAAMRWNWHPVPALHRVDLHAYLDPPYKQHSYFRNYHLLRRRGVALDDPSTKLRRRLQALHSPRPCYASVAFTSRPSFLASSPDKSA